MFNVGRLCVKTAGRDAMEYCVIVEEVDETYVIVDGNTRRKKVNKAHLEPLNKTIDVKKGAKTEEVHKAFEELDIAVKVKGEARSPKPQEKKVKVKKDDKKDKKKSKKE